MNLYSLMFHVAQTPVIAIPKEYVLQMQTLIFNFHKL